MSFDAGPQAPPLYRHPSYPPPQTPLPHSQPYDYPPTYGAPHAEIQYAIPITATGKRKAQRASQVRTEPYVPSIGLLYTPVPSFADSVVPFQACDSCRQLKAKCDETKPCKSCKEKKLECKYRDPAPKQ